MTDYHPGLEGVIATESSISNIDGKKEFSVIAAILLKN